MSNLTGTVIANSLFQNLMTMTRQSLDMGFFIVVDIISLLLGLGGIYCLYLSVRLARWRSRLRRDGVRVEARITSQRIVSRRRGMVWKVTFRYDYQGQTYSQEQNVSMKYYQLLNVGADVLVCCFAHHPFSARVIDAETKRIVYQPGEGWGTFASWLYVGIFLLIAALCSVGQVLSVLLSKP